MSAEAKNLKAIRNGEQVVLTWETTSTTNLLGFIVEESVEGGPWTKLPELPPAVSILTRTQPKAAKYRVWDDDKNGVSGTVEVQPAPTASVQIVLTDDRSGIKVLSAPANTATITFAGSDSPNEGNTKYFRVSLAEAVAHPFTPPAGYPYAGARADNSSGIALGTWAGRIQTTPVAPPSPVTTMRRGWNGGGWPLAGELADLKLGKADCVRLETPRETLPYTKNGQEVIYLESGPYLSGGIKSIDVASDVAHSIATVKAYPDILALEKKNEPGGNWFWGSGAESVENAAAYCRLLKALSEAFIKEFGSKAPLIFASFDGGHAGDNTWGKHMLAADPKVVNYVDAFTEHPYDGSGANPASTLVHFGAVEEAHALTGKPIAITEYGRPTISGTGDSPKSTLEQQANADAAMVRKSREVGYVIAVMIFGYVSGAQGYGIFNKQGSPKPAVEAIAKA